MISKAVESAVVSPTIQVNGAEEYGSSTPLPPKTRYRNLSDLLLRPASNAEASSPVLLGTIGDRQVDITLGQLQSFILDIADCPALRSLCAGDTVCLLRLPRTNELLLAVAYAALTAMNLRVLLPMYPEPQALSRWLGLTRARAVIACNRELEVSGTEADRLRGRRLAEEITRLKIPMVCLEDDLHVSDVLVAADPAGPRADHPQWNRFSLKASSRSECLILTTAGTSGASKLVRYRQAAILRSCTAWETAELFQPERLGGRALCLLFSHSMGIRAFWNAVWTRQALCLIPPEWFMEHPERVRTLLFHMRPEHVTGGPAVYRALLELVRVFPDLKDGGLAGLRCGVSTGASFDADLARQLDAALGIGLYNAFGTSETMQVLSTLVGGGSDRTVMGKPLPGVRIVLASMEDEPGLKRLFIHSPFGFTGYLNHKGANPPAPYWYATGDLVECAPEGLKYVGRENDAFVKDGFGVKVPRRVVAGRYAGLGEPVIHVEWYPLREEPGLAGLLFIKTPADCVKEYDGLVTDRDQLARVRARIEACHEALQQEIDDFELRHLTIERFACIAGPPPRTAKGNVSAGEIERRHRSLLGELTGRYIKRAGMVRLDRDRMLQSSSTRFIRPRLGRMLKLLRLDVEYRSGRGDRLVMREKGSEREVVDFVGGFGSTLLGHRHPAVVEAAERFLASGAVPLADQGSERSEEGALARRLAQWMNRMTGGSYVVRFGSTGAEAVEIALAHALVERDEKVRRFCRDQRRLFGGVHSRQVAQIVRTVAERIRASIPQVLAIEGSFHGYSLGARSVSHLRRTRGLFAPLFGVDCVFLPTDGDPDVNRLVRDALIKVPALAWRDGRVIEEEAQFSRIIAAIAEPVRGEGGVKMVGRDLLMQLTGRDFPLIIDEIQCGLGRTGRLLASEGIPGHYYLLGKALGNGIAKISAVIIDRTRYVERFDEYFTGTFSGDALSCTVASAVLDVIEKDEVPRRAAERGAELRRRLDSILRDHPTVVRSVGGLGLMMGIELAPEAAAESMLVRMTQEREQLGLLAASYLLRRWQVRVLPTLSAPNTLRFEPSAYVDDGALERLEISLRAFCKAIERRNLDEIVGVLVTEEKALDNGRPSEPASPVFSGRIEPPAFGAARVAFINHFILPERELAFVEPSLARLPIAARRALFNRLVGLMDLKPTIAFARNLFEGRVWFASIVLPVDPATLEEMDRSRRNELIVQRFQEALDMGNNMGCIVGGLGAYSSILTNDGLALLPPPGMKLSTGNSLTVAVGVRRVVSVSRRLGLDRAGTHGRVGVLGAAGNIGRAVARRLVRGDNGFHRLLLVGRHDGPLHGLAEELRALSDGECVIETSTSLDDLRECCMILAATGTNEPLIFPRHLAKDRTVVVADLSVPSILAARVRAMPNVHLVPLAGTVTVPGTPDFAMASHIAQGTAFSCAGESMLLALAPHETADLECVGPVRDAAIEKFDELAQRFGLVHETGHRAPRRAVQ